MLWPRYDRSVNRHGIRGVETNVKESAASALPGKTTTADAPPADELSRRIPGEREPLKNGGKRGLSGGQVKAIFDAMRTFRDDDLSRDGGDETFECGRCGRRRPAAGSLIYGDLRLCNGCATDYELLHTAGIERDF